MMRYFWPFLFYFAGDLSAVIAGSLALDQFTTKDGLIHNQVTALYHEENGYLWIGTQGGLCRFNGLTFDDFSGLANVPSSPIVGIAGDGGGRIWIVCDNSLYLFADGEFRCLVSEVEGTVRAFLLDSHQRIWLGPDKGVLLHEGSETTGFGTQDGLPNRRVITFLEDQRGRIWAGFRHGGLACYDPSNGLWLHYTTDHGLTHENINGLHQTPDGTLWIATHRGLTLYDGSVFAEAPFNQSLPSPIVYGIFEDSQGRLWFNAPHGGVSFWDGSALTLVNSAMGLVSDFILGIREDGEGRLWFSSNKGLGILDGGGYRIVDSDSGLSSNMVTACLPQKDGLVWVGTFRGLHRYEPSRLDTFLRDPSGVFLPNGSMAREIVRDHMGNLWFPSLQGLGLFNQEQFTLFTVANGLPSNEVHQFLEDRLGRIWVGTSLGIALRQGSGFIRLEHPFFGKNPIQQLLEDGRGRIWILDRNQEIWKMDDPSPTPNVSSFRSLGRFDSVLKMHAQEDGPVWVETARVLYKIDEKMVEIQVSGLMPDAKLTSRYFDKKGIWWFGTLEGIYKYDGTAVQHLELPEPVSQHAVFLIQPGVDGTLWAGTALPPQNLLTDFRFSGLLRYDGSNFTLWDKESGLSVEGVRKVFVDSRGNEWLFSGKGLSRLQSGTFEHLTVSQGLAGNLPRKVLWDNRGNLWIATNGGLNKAREGMITSLSLQDGLIDAEIHDIELDKAQDLWIRTASGVQRYREHRQGPGIELAGLFDGEKPLPQTPGLVLEHNQNNLIFRVSGIHLRKGADQMQYVYQLSGENETPSGITHEAERHFPGLRPGSYTFTIKAYNRDLYASEPPVVFPFVIRSPFWLRPWFLAAMALAALLVGYLVNRIRLGQKLEKARVVNELLTAHHMQMSLMPKSAPRLKGYEMAGICEPAREVGGDFYDYFWLDDSKERLGFAIIDVSGKSMEAAMIAVMTSGLVYSEIRSCHSPATILNKINYPLFKKTGKQVFTTGIVGSIDLPRKRMSLANAGHMDPILIRNGEFMELSSENPRDLPLGVKNVWTYGDRHWDLLAGDLVLFYTDGLTETMNGDHELFGVSRVVRYLKDYGFRPAADLVQGLSREAKRFAAGQAQHDDITFFLIKVL